MLIFFIHEEYEMGLIVFYLLDLFRNGYFDILSRVKNALKFLFVCYLNQFLLHICALIVWYFIFYKRVFSDLWNFNCSLLC